MSNILNTPSASADVPSLHAATRQGSWVIQPLEKRLEAYERFQELAARGKSTHELVLAITKEFG